jgi:nitrate/nitrite-specific signal transduction histidine kinase
VPYRKINDAAKLQRLVAAILMIEADVELPELLRHLVEEATELVAARFGALGVLNEARTALDQFVTVGLSDEEERLIGARPTGRGVLGLLITDPAALRLDDLRSHPDSYGYPAHHPPMDSFLGVPVRVRGEVYGNLYLTDKLNADTFSEEDEFMVGALALAAGVAIENTRLNATVSLLRMLEDRDRIARDLHDQVIQRIFAVGISLQGATRIGGPSEIVDRVNQAVDDLDSTMDDIRTAIFDLEDGLGDRGLRRSVLDLATQMTSLFGFRPQVSFHGPVEAGVSQRMADHALAVLREALTNVSKHAHATQVLVGVTLGEELRIEVTDNGVGAAVREGGAIGGGRGLRNLRSRAERLGGSLEVTDSGGAGTHLVWRVPC